MTTKSAQITEGIFCDRLAEVWPDRSDIEKMSRQTHLHFCELLAAWNLNDTRADSSYQAFVYEDAENIGLTKFIFFSPRDAEAFIGKYNLQDFVLTKSVSYVPYGTVIELTNKFPVDDVRVFLTIYRRAMANLASIHDERLNAVQNDGNKVGFVMVDHFLTREYAELLTIQVARETLAKGFSNTGEEMK